MFSTVQEELKHFFKYSMSSWTERNLKIIISYLKQVIGSECDLNLRQLLGISCHIDILCTMISYIQSFIQ